MKTKLTPIARALRKRMTAAELFLWKRLRAKQFEGLKFRRQQPIGPYIVDFVCFEERIIIELDGSQHYEGQQLSIDIERDHWFAQQGYIVLRFANNEVSRNLEGVTIRIFECCHTSTIQK